MSRGIALVALSLALVAALVIPTLSQDYDPTTCTGGASFCYEQCTKCVRRSDNDPTTGGGVAQGWDTANQYNINLDFAVNSTPACTIIRNGGDNQQECAAKCVNLGKTGLIESRQGVAGGIDYCLCCKQRCSGLQRLAAALKNGTKAIVFVKKADSKHASICENGTIEGDPHFVGAHGTRYDFNGQPGKTYNLVSMKDLQVNAKLIGYALDGSDTLHTAAAFEEGKQFVRTWMGEMGFLWTDAEGQKHNLRLISRRSTSTKAPGLMAQVILDGTPVAIPTAPGTVVEAAGLRLDFVGVDNDRAYVGETEKWSLSIGEKVTLGLKLDPAHPFIRTSEDAMTHFSLALKHIEVYDDVHGVLGQTFRNTGGQLMKAMQYRILNALLREPLRADGVSGKGFLDGAAEDYVTSGVLKADCVYCTYA